MAQEKNGVQITELFSELFGFVVFDRDSITDLMRQLDTTDLLTPMTNSDLGESVTESGVAIPIAGLEADFYQLVISKQGEDYLDASQIKIVSEGWVLYSHGDVAVCGIGYFYDIDIKALTQTGKLASRKLQKGWHAVVIKGGFDVDDQPTIEVQCRFTGDVKPEYFGDLSTTFNLFDPE